MIAYTTQEASDPQKMKSCFSNSDRLNTA